MVTQVEGGDMGFTLKIQICDDTAGCGAVIRDTFEVPQRCPWISRHPNFTAKGGRVYHTPLMRPTMVVDLNWQESKNGSLDE